VGLIAFTIFELFPLMQVIDLSVVFVADDVASGVATAPGVALGRGSGVFAEVELGVALVCGATMDFGVKGGAPLAQYLNSHPSMVGATKALKPSYLK
jgi:hypothetical protein